MSYFCSGNRYSEGNSRYPERKSRYSERKSRYSERKSRYSERKSDFSESNSAVLVQQNQSCYGTIEYHADGVDLDELHTHEGGKEEEAADAELPRVGGRGGEVVGGH